MTDARTPADELLAAARQSRVGGDGEAGGEERQVIIFGAGERQFALDIGSVERTEPLPAVTPVPRCPLFVRGVASIRGGMVCVVDLRRLLASEGDAEGEQGKDARSLLVVVDGGRRVGVQSESLPDFIRIDSTQVLAPPASAEDLYSGAIERDEKLVGVIETAKLLELIERRLGHG